VNILIGPHCYGEYWLLPDYPDTWQLDGYVLRCRGCNRQVTLVFELSKQNAIASCYCEPVKSHAMSQQANRFHPEPKP
jgi:hypothetical protein